MQPNKSWRVRYPSLSRFLENKVAVISLGAILLLFVVAIFGPMIWPKEPSLTNFELIGEPQPPSLEYPAGTDYQGRDLFARLLAGARISLAVGIVSMLINVLIGVGIGTVAGWLASTGGRIGGFFDTLLMRGVDILYSIPLLLVVILLQIFAKPLMERVVPDRADVPLLFTPDLLSIYIALGLTNWLTMARLSRGEVINLSHQDYVMASRAIGVSTRRILTRHILPNSIGPLAVAATLAVPEAIFIESFLSFIGIGVSAPQASWGTLASDALSSVSVSPHLLVFPAVAISITMLAFNLFGDGLRDALDPSLKQ